MKRNTLLAMVVLCSLILIPNLVMAKTPKGEVVYVTGYPIFYNNGGDAATHAAGQGPFLATTIFEGLVDVAVDLKYLPAIAKRWTVTPDQMTQDYFLNEGIKFHNGDPLTAEDVKFSIETLMRKDLKNVLGHSYRKRIKNIEVVDKYHVRFNLHMPGPGLLKRFWWNGAIFPKKYRESVGDDGFAKAPIGSGPFKWVDYKQDQWFRIEAVKNHHRKTPEIKTFKMVYVVERSTRLAMLMAGEADIIELAGPHIPVVKADPNLRLFQVKDTIGSSIVFIDMGFPEPSPFKDIRVREAMSLAIDRKTICEKIQFGSCSPHGDILAPLNLGYDPSIKPDPYDPERARALLKEAGFPNGFSTAYNTTVAGKLIVEALQANWADIGVKVKINIYEGGAWWEATQAKKLRGMKGRGTWYDVERHPGADLQDGLISTAPWASINIPGMDDMITASMSSKNDEEAFAWGRKISKSFRENRWRIITWSNHHSYGLSKKIVYWDVQRASYPGTRFEYMKIND